MAHDDAQVEDNVVVEADATTSEAEQATGVTAVADAATDGEVQDPSPAEQVETPAGEAPVQTETREDRAARLAAVKAKAKAEARKGGDSNTQIEVREEDMGRPIKGSGRAVAAAHRVVGGGEQDDVFLPQIVYKNVQHKKSLTVHHLQARLNELGYASAAADPDGYYGDHTVKAVRQFQADNDLVAGAGPDLMTKETFAAIFDGDPNVRVRFVRA